MIEKSTVDSLRIAFNKKFGYSVTDCCMSCEHCKLLNDKKTCYCVLIKNYIQGSDKELTEEQLIKCSTVEPNFFCDNYNFDIEIGR